MTAALVREGLGTRRYARGWMNFWLGGKIPLRLPADNHQHIDESISYHDLSQRKALQSALSQRPVRIRRGGHIKWHHRCREVKFRLLRGWFNDGHEFDSVFVPKLITSLHRCSVVSSCVMDNIDLD